MLPQRCVCPTPQQVVPAVSGYQTDPAAACPCRLQASAAAAAAAAGSIPELPPYQELEARAAAAADGTPLLVLAPGERSHFDRLLRSFQLSGAVKDQALALYVNSKVRDGNAAQSGCVTVQCGACSVMYCSAVCRSSGWGGATRTRSAVPLPVPAAVCQGGAQVPGMAAGCHGRSAA